jgi:hypothetical protein
MVLKAIVPALVGASLIACGTASAANYRPDEFLGLDLSKAVLSPTPLGPESTFAPVAVEAKSDAKSDTASGVLPRSNARKVAIKRVKGAPVRTELVSANRRDGRLARAPATKPRAVSPTRLVRRHGNPLNAQAMDTRIQKWPCNPDMGGICAWQH